MSGTPSFQLLLLLALLLCNVHSFLLRRKDDNDEVCDDILGCFPLAGAFYHEEYRPFKLAPFAREEINTTFTLFTKSNHDDADILNITDENSIINSHFDGQIPTKFIIHGYLEHRLIEAKWMVKMKDELLQWKSCNVIDVNWRGGNNYPYNQATVNTRVVGAEIAYLIKLLMKLKGVTPDSFHVIGHSLGAQVAGYVGEKIENLGRITGLDPASPHFENMPEEVRLDSGDAILVDIIHSDLSAGWLPDPDLERGLGMRGTCGHYDFYPNNGTNQPGCSYERLSSFVGKDVRENLRLLTACSHLRSVELFMESINQATHEKCRMVGFPCSSFKEFTNGLCTTCSGDWCPVLGLHFVPPDEDYKEKSHKSEPLYLTTTDEEPFCKYYYVVRISFENGTQLELVPGKLKVTAKGDFHLNFLFDRMRATIIDQSTIHFVIQENNDAGQLTSIDVQWIHPRRLLNPFTWRANNNLVVEYIEVSSMHSDRDRIFRFCYKKGDKEIKRNKVYKFTKEC